MDSSHFTWDGNACNHRQLLSREALSDSKSLSHILKHKMLTSQLSSVAA